MESGSIGEVELADEDDVPKWLCFLVLFGVWNGFGESIHDIYTSFNIHDTTDDNDHQSCQDGVIEGVEGSAPPTEALTPSKILLPVTIYSM